jgi:hypothetical protein
MDVNLGGINFKLFCVLFISQSDNLTGSVGKRNEINARREKEISYFTAVPANE